jgi:hypothetical protein
LSLAPVDKPQTMFMVRAGFIPHESGRFGSALELEG